MLLTTFFIALAGLSSTAQAFLSDSSEQSLCPPTILKNQPESVLEVPNACYRVVTNQATNFWSAEAECRKDGGNLASFASVREFNPIYRKLSRSKGTFWIGLYRPKKEKVDSDKFRWTDGSDFNYVVWKNGQGKKGTGQACVTMDMSEQGRWSGVMCRCKAEDCPNFICKYGPDAQKRVDDDDDEAAIIADKGGETPVKTTTVTVADVGGTDECEFNCPDLDCGMDGYREDPFTGCQLCECNL